MTRISGIIFGVVTTMVMSVVVFPKSASHQATDHLKAGLAALAALNALAWRRGRGCTATQDIMQPPHVGRSPPHRSSSRPVHCTETDHEGEEEEEGPTGGVDECCDEVCPAPCCLRLRPDCLK